MTWLRTCSIVIAGASLALAACGGDDDGGTGDGGTGAACGFAGDGFLPLGVGYRWEFRVTDLGSGAVEIKRQSMSSTDGVTFKQVTDKTNGSTESNVKLDGDRVVRLDQTDLDAASVVERTTVYAPYQIRIDEGALLRDGTLTETYTETVTDSTGTLPPVTTTESWTVVDDAESCETPFGTASCLHVRRTRTAGGVADKEFWFARGIGKVREEGGQLEVLTACSVD
jgi:hypothetical protein